MTLTPAPTKPVPLDDTVIRILVDGDRCDTCGALAYTRAHILNAAGELIGTMHFCCHHYARHEVKLLERQLAGRATITDERRYLWQMEADRTRAVV